MRKISGFETPDGKFFTDEAEARKHEEKLNTIIEMESFLADRSWCPYSKASHLTMAEKIIEAWENWKRAGRDGDKPGPETAAEIGGQS